jgi:hypothetical protein
MKSKGGRGDCCSWVLIWDTDDKYWHTDDPYAKPIDNASVCH